MSESIDELATRASISYAHDSEQHKEHVRAFAELLSLSGIDVELDRWAEGQRANWGVVTDQWALDSDYILVIGSPDYQRAAAGLLPSSRNRGVQSEASLIRDLLHRDRATWTARILPVLLPGHGIDEIPDFLQPYSSTHYVVSELTDSGVEDLLRTMTKQPEFVRPPRGPVRHLPPRPSALSATTDPIAESFAERPAAPNMRLLSRPVEVRWRADFVPRSFSEPPSTLETHIVPAPSPDALRVPVSRLQTMEVDLTSLGRTRGFFSAKEEVKSDWNAESAWALTHDSRQRRTAGLAVHRNGQRSAWLSLPRVDFGIAEPVQSDLTERLGSMLAVLLAIDLPTPRDSVPTAGIQPLGMFLTPINDGIRGNSIKMLDAPYLRLVPDEAMSTDELRQGVSTVAHELAANLIALYRKAR